MPFLEDGDWIMESKAKPKDNALWSQARKLARLDKEYSPRVALILSRKIYSMMGGTWVTKNKRKRK